MKKRCFVKYIQLLMPNGQIFLKEDCKIGVFQITVQLIYAYNFLDFFKVEFHTVKECILKRYHQSVFIIKLYTV